MLVAAYVILLGKHGNGGEHATTTYYWECPIV